MSFSLSLIAASTKSVHNSWTWTMSGVDNAKVSVTGTTSCHEHTHTHSDSRGEDNTSPAVVAVLEPKHLHCNMCFYTAHICNNRRRKNVLNRTTGTSVPDVQYVHIGGCRGGGGVCTSTLGNF